MRIAAILEYDGSNFSGWQQQDNARSIQGVVEEALSRVADEPVQVTVAGRTDAGVHASAQVIHFDTSAVRGAYSWVRGANSHLPPDVAVLWAGPVDDGFHARYSATGRYYHYLILNRAVRPTWLARRVTHEYRPLDIARMQQGACFLTGEHDFTSFRATECQAKSPVRELRALDVTRQGEFVHVRAHANAFLHHMVRNLAGVLMDIGAGEREPDWAGEVLAARDRRAGGVTAAAEGLYLVSVTYPPAAGVPDFPHALLFPDLS
ncbi:MAG: tRNA pseudouridine(38-40) synthase TruA [Gammaproteobacteria bacterium]|nr:tRNA pseudouridine(38-40) synthase TruA [Gammaproteobacteria bacterium]